MQYCALALALIVLADARPLFQAPMDSVEGSPLRYVKEETISRDIEKGEEKIAYDVTLSDNVVVVDQWEEVEAVQCDGLQMTLTFMKGKAAVEVGKILVGGEEWGCIHPKFGTPQPFYRRVLGIVKEDTRLDTITIDTELVPLVELFSKANVNYKNVPVNNKDSLYEIPQGTVIGQAVPEKEDENEPTDLGDIVEFPDEEDKHSLRGSDSDFIINDLDLVYVTGDTIKVSYKTTEYVNKEIKICLRIKRFGFDKTVTCKTVIMKNKDYHTTEFFVYSNYESSSAYYIEFSRPVLFGHSWESNEFGVNPGTVILTPTHGEEFYPGFNIDLSWYVSPANKGKTVELALVKDRVIDKTVKTWRFALSTQKKSISVDSLPKSVDSGDYYFRITYGCVIGSYFCDLKETSDVFSLSRDQPGQKSISFITPKEGSVYKNGAQIGVSWVSNAMSSSDILKISLCRETWGFDYCVKSRESIKNTGKFSFVTKTSWKPSSQYYIVIQYNCKLFWCSSRETRRFAINFDPQFEFTSPREGETFDPQTITFKYKLRKDATISPNKEVTVKLIRQVPLLDLLHNDAQATLTAGTGSHNFVITEGTIFPVRFVISYDCKLFGFFCKREYSPIFYIPVKYQSGWNYNPTKRIEIINLACGEKCKGKTNAFCKLCSNVPDLDAKIDVACEKCYITTTVQAYDFGLNVNWLGVTAASLNVHASATANFDFLIQFDAAYKLEKDFEIAHYDIFGLSFKVGPVSIKLGARLALNSTFAFGISGSAKVAAGFDATVAFDAVSSYGGVKGDDTNIKFGLTRYNKHDPTIDLRVMFMVMLD